MYGSLFVKPTATILSIVPFFCTSVRLYFCTTIPLPYVSIVRVQYSGSNVHSSLLHLGSKLRFSTLYIVLVGAITLRGISNVWPIKVLRGGGWVGCCSKPPLKGWRGRSLLGVENWKWRSASQWRLLQCGYYLHRWVSGRRSGDPSRTKVNSTLDEG